MKSKIYLSRLLALMMTMFIFIGCEEEGCTDVNACNYDSAAEKDDGTCNYGCSTGGGGSGGTSSGNECTGGQTRQNGVLASTQLNLFDYVTGSSNYGNIFAVMSIDMEKYEECENGYWKYNGVTDDVVKIQNVTSKTITFDIYIYNNGNGNIRSYQTYIQGLKPGDVKIINTGDNTFWNVRTVPIQYSINNITYL